MTPEQAFNNLVAIVLRAQKGGLLELHEAVAVNESLQALHGALGLKALEQVDPVVEKAAE